MLLPSEHLAQVRLMLDEPSPSGSSPRWFNGELMQRLEDAEKFVYRQLVAENDTLFLRSTDINLVAGQATYDLPLNARLGTRWALIEDRSGGTGTFSYYVYDQRFQDFLVKEGEIGSTQDPRTVSLTAVIEGDKLRISPTPSTSISSAIRFWYNPMFGSMCQGTVQTAQAIGTTSLVMPSTPTYYKGGAVSAGGLDIRDDYFNGMDVIIYSGTGVGQKRRISDFAGSTRTLTVDTAWATALTDATDTAPSLFAILSPIPEDHQITVVEEAAWRASVKRPQIRKLLSEQLGRDMNDTVGWFSKRQSFRDDAVEPSDMEAY